MKSIGILVDSLRNTGMTYTMINALNVTPLSVSVFYKDVGVPAVVPKFSVSGFKDAYRFPGPVISTSIETTKILKKTFNMNKYFYIWDFEWMNNRYNFQELAEVYLDPNIRLLCRSEEHAEKVSKIWQEPIVIKDFDQLNSLLKTST